MIKFFRKIRQQLLTENKFTKYILYAIGEIALVVIGILIALQINNWNEQQKLDAKEIKYLQEVKSELTFTLADLKNDIPDLQRNLNSASVIGNLIINKESYDDSLLLHFEQILDTETLSAKQSAFEALENIGLDIISNDSIRQAITHVYLIIRRIVATKFVSSDNWNPNKLRSLLEVHLRIDRESDKIALITNNSKYLGTKKLPFKFRNYDKFIKDEQFLYTLINSIEWRKAQIIQHQRFQSMLENVISMLEKELENIEK